MVVLSGSGFSIILPFALSEIFCHAQGPAVIQVCRVRRAGPGGCAAVPHWRDRQGYRETHAGQENERFLIRYLVAAYPYRDARLAAELHIGSQYAGPPRRADSPEQSKLPPPGYQRAPPGR